ncbi:MAG: hypothetical protein Q4C89_05495 [Deinococcus sp.]|uniref:hypothetical protein n=1 Tax=Deinococcus sp. TaxID=47478 RepID=UPI0026DDACDB|nr:hypothetical protein [Deinococcus sp.]MDO4245456.1 hypothetical protein [Deinococcus sp.]
MRTTPLDLKAAAQLVPEVRADVAAQIAERLPREFRPTLEAFWAALAEAGGTYAALERGEQRFFPDNPVRAGLFVAVRLGKQQQALRRAERQLHHFRTLAEDAELYAQRHGIRDAEGFGQALKALSSRMTNLLCQVQDSRTLALQLILAQRGQRGL